MSISKTFSHSKATLIKRAVSSVLVFAIAATPLCGVLAAAGVNVTHSSGSTVLSEGGNTSPSYGYTFQVGGSVNDSVEKVRTDNNGNLYVAGLFAGTADIDPTNGVLNVTSASPDNPHYTGNVVGAGGVDSYFSKVNSDGTLAYAYHIGNDKQQFLYDMIVDNNGNLYAAGMFSGTMDFDPTSGVDNKSAASYAGDFFTKINADGSYGYTKVSDNIVFYGLAKSSSGDVYIAGYFKGTDINLNFIGSVPSDIRTSSATYDAFVIKINSDGSYGGSHVFSGTQNAASYRVDIDSSGNIYLLGCFEGDFDLDPTSGTDIKTAVGFYDMFLVKINADGSYGFGKVITGSGYEFSEDIKIDNLGNIYFSGVYNGTVDIDNDGTVEATASALQGTFIAKLDSSGNYIFKYTLMGTPNGSSSGAGTAQIRSIAIDSNNDIYYSGMISSAAAVDFDITGGAGDLKSFVVYGGAYRAFFTKLNADGSYGYTNLVNTYSNNEYSSIAVAPDGRIYAGGYFDSIPDMDPTVGIDNKTSLGSYDGFVTMFVPNDVYMVSLSDIPTSNVTVTETPNNDLYLSSSNAQPSTADPVVLIFTPVDWNVDRFIFVKAIDDTVNESAGQTGFVKHTTASADLAFNGLVTSNVIVTINDNGNDIVPVISTVTEPGGSTWVSEAGITDTYTVVLSDQPIADVVVTPNPGTQLTVSPALITFTSTNWNVPQTITVGAVDDALVEGNHNAAISHTAVSTDPIFNGITVANVTVNIVDNDGATVNISNYNLSVAEGGATATYDITLGPLTPASNVRVDFVDGVHVTAVDSANPTNSYVIFTPANYNVAQTILVTAVDDLNIEGNHSTTIAHSTVSVDPNYNSLTILPVAVNITDNDSPGVNITESAGNTAVTEGGASDSYDVVLGAQPSANVNVAISNDANVTVVPASLTFTSVNWNVAQTVTVTAVDNSIADGNRTSVVAHSATSSDSNYNGISVSNVSVAVSDNDAIGATITDSLNVTEGGTTDTYTVVLNSQPTGNVVITISPNAQITVSPSVLTFTSANWNVPQTVIVTAVNDSAVEGTPHTGIITYAVASSDSSYNGISLANSVVSITDNDSAGGGGGGGGGYIAPQPNIPTTTNGEVTATSNLGGTTS
ncbi:MAG: FG-GAP repeat protein, partial [Microgenomates group bacterium GW2011_GWA2_46_7]